MTLDSGLKTLDSLDAAGLQVVPSTWPLIANGKEILFTANKDLSIGDGRRCIDRFAYRVGRKNFMFGPSFHHECISVLARQQDLSLKSNGRRREGCGYGDAATFIFHFAGPGVKTR